MPPDYLTEKVEDSEILQGIPCVHQILYETYRYRAYPSSRVTSKYLTILEPRKGMSNFVQELCDTVVKVSTETMTATNTGSSSQWVNARCQPAFYGISYRSFKLKFTNYTMLGFETKENRQRCVNTYAGTQSEGWQWYSATSLYHSGSPVSTTERFVSGDVVGILMDLTQGKATFYKNGSPTNVIVTGLSSEKEYYPVISFYSTGDSATIENSAWPDDIPWDSSSKKNTTIKKQQKERRKKK